MRLDPMRVVCLLIFAALFWPINAFAQVPMTGAGLGAPASAAPGSFTVTFQGNVINSSALSAYTFASYPIGAASSDRQVECAVLSNSGTASNFTGAKINGVAATTDEVITGGSTRILAMFHGPAISGTTASVEADFDASQTRASLFCWTITGTALTAPNAKSNSGVVSLNTTSAASLAVPAATVPSGGILLAAAFNSDLAQTTTVTPSTGAGALDFEGAIGSGYRSAAFHESLAASIGLTIANAGSSALFRGASVTWGP